MSEYIIQFVFQNTSMISSSAPSGTCQLTRQTSQLIPFSLKYVSHAFCVSESRSVSDLTSENLTFELFHNIKSGMPWFQNLYYVV